MAVRSGNTPPKKNDSKITIGDVKVLLCAAVFLASVLLRYADFDSAKNLRVQAAALLHGGMGAQQVMQVLGQLTEDGGLQEVFAQKDHLAQVFGVSTVKEDQQEVKQETQPANTQEITSAAGTAENPTEMQADSGYEEDLIDRTESNFPKEADQVAYIMSFSHVNPVKGTLSSAFGMRTHPVSGKQTFHYGLDIAADKGTPIGALAGGTVRKTGESSYGKYVIVDHADGFSTLYAHCSAILANKGDTVKAGQEIAQVGATGIATGNHLHLEVWHDGKALNPKNYVSYKSTSADS